MQAALSGFRNVFRIKELRDKVLFTLAMLLIYRLGGYIPVPGVNPGALSNLFSSNNNLFSLYNTFVGGALSRAAIFSLGIMPYITASIIIQLAGTVSKQVKDLQKMGQEGRAKLTQWTRYGTIIISAVQSIGISTWLLNAAPASGGEALLVAGMNKWGFIALTTITLTAGTVFIMWLGEQITARGIGNGISLIIFIGIIAQVPPAIITEYQFLVQGIHSIANEFVIIAIVVIIVMFIIFIDQGTRRIPLQSPRRIVGRKVMGGQSSFLPLKVNTAGVMPVIFASAIMFLPAQIASFLPDVSFAQSIGRMMLPGQWLYSVVYVVLIVFFTYFYTAIQYNPTEIADNLKKSGGFIPGIRPGRRTAEFIDVILTRVTLTCAVFLAFISVGPFWLKDKLDMSFYIGGTSVLICIGVALETLRQLQAKLQEQNYDGFMKKGKIRGKRKY